MPRVLPELLVDEPQAACDGTHGRSAHALDVRILLQQHEQLEKRRRRTNEDVVADRLERPVTHLEAWIQRPRWLALIEDRLAEQLQQQLVQQTHVHDSPVVPLHELLDRQGVGSVLVPESLGELELMIEEQAVFPPSRHDVQPEPDLPQHRLRLFQTPQFGTRQEAARDESVQCVGAEMPFGHPGDRLDIAQSARPCLDVGLEVVGGVVRLEMTLGLFADLGFEELLHRPDAVGSHRLAHSSHQRFIAGDQPRLDECRHHTDIGRALLRAFLHGPNAMADFETNIPKESDETLDHPASGGGGHLRDQQQDVDVRAGVQLAATVAAYGNECPRSGVRNRVRAPDLT